VAIKGKKAANTALQSKFEKLLIQYSGRGGWAGPPPDLNNNPTFLFHQDLKNISGQWSFQLVQRLTCSEVSNFDESLPRARLVVVPGIPDMAGDLLLG
jgi:hypothetical protein